MRGYRRRDPHAGRRLLSRWHHQAQSDRACRATRRGIEAIERRIMPE
jgi:hypothetical protein